MVLGLTFFKTVLWDNQSTFSLINYIENLFRNTFHNQNLQFLDDISWPNWTKRNKPCLNRHLFKLFKIVLNYFFPSVDGYKGFNEIFRQIPKFLNQVPHPLTLKFNFSLKLWGLEPWNVLQTISPVISPMELICYKAQK